MTSLNQPIARIKSDDRDYDLEDQRELIIAPFEKGWLIEIVPVDSGFQYPVEVHSHGVTAKNIMLAEFIGDAYYSSLRIDHPDLFPEREYFTQIIEEANEWRRSYKKQGRIRLPDSNSEEFAIFPTDNDSLPSDQQKSLHIGMGGNGDWYVQTMSVEDGDYRGVRLALSGGTSWRYPNLCVSIAQSFRIIHKPFLEEEIVRYDDLYKEVQEWRSRYPDKEYDGLFLSNKRTEI